MQAVDFLVLNLALLTVAPHMPGPHGLGARVYGGCGSYALPPLNRTIDDWNTTWGPMILPLPSARSHALLGGDLVVASDSSIYLIFSYDCVRMSGQGWVVSWFEDESSYAHYQLTGDFVTGGLLISAGRPIPVFVMLMGGVGWARCQQEIYPRGSRSDGTHGGIAFGHDIKGSGLIGEIGLGTRQFLTPTRTVFAFVDMSYRFRNLPIGRDSGSEARDPSGPLSDNLDRRSDLDFSGAALKIGIGRDF